MTQVFVAQHPTEAHLIRGVLEANGIAAEVHGESLFATRGEAPATPDTLPTVWVVDDAEAARARSILAANGRAEIQGDGLAWTCRACGELVESQFTECWSCGAARPETPSGVQ